MLSLEKVIENARLWAREAGKVQMQYLGKSHLINTKSNAIDLVTEADRLSEQLILEGIQGSYPEHSILSEERGSNEVESDYRWVIDPLDGTTNYAQGLPNFAVSIALQYQEKTILGVVYGPVRDQMFEAVKGEFASLNGRKIKVGSKTNLMECVLATDFPYDRAVHPDNNVNYTVRILPKVRGLRQMGSAAYDLANVAAGILDGYWELNLNPWDVAAGALVVEEAGGCVHYLTEKRGVSLIAGNSIICGKILDEIINEDKS
ncbi:MAG TPA: inositol monophosphatase family protein [Syntrophomonadaceae bacterium]|nr:inositol monophosphatase family protein [Syntrophomonadaceae bacterium]